MEKKYLSLREMASRADAPIALGSTVNLLVKAGYERANHDFKKYVDVQTVPNFNEVRRSIIDTSDDALQPVLEYEAYPEMNIRESASTWAIVKWGRLLRVSYEMFVNDDQRKLRDLATGIGRLAGQAEIRLVTSLYAGLAADTDDNGALSGALTDELLERAIALFEERTDADGNPLAIEPKYVVAKPKFVPYLNQFFRPSTDLDFNPHAGQVEIISNPYLPSNKIIFFTDPATLPAIEFDYLRVPFDPREDYTKGPRILVNTAQPAQAVLPGDVGTAGDGFRYDSISYKVRHVFGAGIVSRDAMVVVDIT